MRGGDSGAEPPAVAYPKLSEHGSAEPEAKQYRVSEQQRRADASREASMGGSSVTTTKINVRPRCREPQVSDIDRNE